MARTLTPQGPAARLIAPLYMVSRWLKMWELDSIRTYSSAAHISLCIQFLAFTAAVCFVAVIMESAKNKKILQGRSKTSLGVENAWYPLSFNASFYDRNPRVVAVWDMVSISRKDFKGLVEAHGMWIKPRKLWDYILRPLQLEHACVVQNRRLCV